MDPRLQTLIKVTAFLAAVHICAGAAYFAYSRLSRRLEKSSTGTPIRTVVLPMVACLPMLAAWLVTVAFCLFLDRIPLRAIGLAVTNTTGSELGVGAAVALSGVTLIFLVGRACRWLRVQRSDIFEDFRGALPMFCSMPIYLIGLAIAEELACRGYIFLQIFHSYGGAVAVVGSAALFALWHVATQRRLPAVYLLNAFLFGLVAANLRLATGTLWAPISLHVVWNLAEYCVYGFPFSTGELNRRGLMTSVVTGRKPITGGNLGPESGLICSGAIAFSAIIIAILVPS